MNLFLTNGCFDLFHEGHRHFFEELSKIDSSAELVVFVNSNSSVRKLKPGRPVDPYTVRCANVTKHIKNLFSKFSVQVFPDDNCVTQMNREVNSIHRLPSYPIYVKDAESGLDGPEALWALSQKIPVLSIPRLPGVSTTQIIERIGRVYQASAAGPGRDSD